ncbi:filamentous hemagglutinin N-terminal domain-containing protein [Cupriavidus pampae]|uniref:Filamentous haemagglutinin FhaB/tRNA nuclease CdiA-like TPS domain-containing protein n=1 Tax=Cupriavidus pampae TaxID=659251 RepID=A0ABM8XPI3_9BURK|nr:filamentous hemagglutinin N-terminal domain-containing protein [Cupriavidus pampae]CAG9182137.1 hypothetical protein LMG32289_05044 [Cupriavidus pampae]
MDRVYRGGHGLVVVMACHLGMMPFLAAAQSAVVAEGRTNTRVTVADTGATVIDIATANAAGLSHNRYARFDVDAAGLVLNNAVQDVAQVRARVGSEATALAGGLVPNANLTAPASVILNEVMGPHASHLRGMLSVHGATADVMVANPYGITCSGCSFLNTDRVVLTTGVPQIDDNGAVETFLVRQGTVTVDEGGMDASGQKSLDIIARAINIEGDIQAQALSLHAGSGEDAAQGEMQGDAGRPARMIGSAPLGGAHGDRIRLSVSRLGVGVRGSEQAPQDVESEDGLNAPGSEGRLRIVRKITATGDVSLSGGAIGNSGRIESKGDIRVLGRSFVNRGDVVGNGHVLLSATAIVNGLKQPRRLWLPPSHRRTFRLARPSVMSRLSLYEPVERHWRESQVFAEADRVQAPVISAGKTMRMTFFVGKNVGGRLESAGTMSLTGLGRGIIQPVFHNNPLLLETRHFVERAWRPRGWLRLFMPQQPFHQAGMPPPPRPEPASVETHNTLAAGIRAPVLQTTDFELSNIGGIEQSGEQAGVVTDKLIVGKVAEADMRVLKRGEIPPPEADAEMVPKVRTGTRVTLNPT